MQLGNSGIELEYALHGDPQTQPVVLFVPGLGSQLIEWPDEMVAPLISNGKCVLLFDNRDSGLSSTLDNLVPRNEVLLARECD
jgi:pimeloyl-ACP methyl ester carboxylesterase